MESLLEIYEDPDAHAGLYNYAKALEDVEAGLLAGFFHKHYCLASNVIGSQSKGMLRGLKVCLHDLPSCTGVSRHCGVASVLIFLWAVLLFYGWVCQQQGLPLREMYPCGQS